MPLTPEEIETKEFLVVLRGYDKDEVGSFLRVVAEDMRALTAGGGEPGEAAAEAAEVPDAQEPAAAPPAEEAAALGGDKFADLGAEMASVLRAANEAAASVRRKAEEEASTRIQAATDEASGVRKAASDEADAILTAARQVRSEAAQEASDTRESATREAAETRSNAVREAEQIVEASLARRDRLAREVTELQRRLESAQDTLRTLLGIVGEAQLGDEPGTNGDRGASGSGHEQSHNEGETGSGDDNVMAEVGGDDNSE